MGFLAFRDVSSLHLKFQTVQLTDQFACAQLVVIALRVLVPAP
jgi:hypothetical protein